jgi:transcription antitermination protein NusB
VRERSRAREWALRVLYAWESRQAGKGIEPVLEEFLERRVIGPDRRPYLRRLVATLDADLPAIDAELQRCLTNWRLERLSVMDRNVLRLAGAEMMRFDDVPPRVSIQEALRLAEKYGTDRSPAFVNGVLDALMRRLPGS